jgi:dTDP-4-dehydrorhamnose reductase
MRILLLGANGQLGRSFLLDSGLAARGELVAASRDGTLIEGGLGEAGDLADPVGLWALLDRVQPQLIVNAAAYTAVDRAEQEEALAMRVNGEAPGVLGGWAAEHQSVVLHYSTDYVFDGQARHAYPVDAPTAPLGAYGRSKLAGEQALRASGCDYLILRTAWVYAAHGHNFLRTMLRLGAERDELRVVADQRGSPTSTALIVRGSLAALDRWWQADAGERQALAGTYHLVASGITSWHGFATAIFEQAVARGLLARSPRVVPIDTADFPTPARRPAWSVLDNSGFQQGFGFPLPAWQDGLNDVMDALSHRASRCGFSAQ